MALDSELMQKIVQFLLPFMSTEVDCRTLCILAFGPDHPLLKYLNFSGSPQSNVTLLVNQAHIYGEIHPGVPALWALLECLRPDLGGNKQAEIDQFRAQLGLPPPPLPDRVLVIYSRHNEAFARRIELDLQDAGLKVWFDRAKIRGGEEWRQATRRGVERADFVVFCLSPESVISESCRWELEVAQKNGKLVIPVMLIDCLPLLSDPAQQSIAWVRDRHILDFTHSDQYGRSFQELLAALPGYNPPDNFYEDTLDTRRIPNPFRGLEAFQELDYHYFAGREDDVVDLVQRVQDPTKPHLLAVVGASGSGKSSLVQAGLVPSLRNDLHRQWTIAVFKPGLQPVKAIAERIGQPGDELYKRFLEDRMALHEYVKSTLSGERDTARCLLIVDQFEEVFTSAAEGERQAFLNLLLSAVTAPQAVIHVILTMRADFFSFLSAYPELARLVEDNLFIATAMRPAQLRRCIEVPAEKVGLIYEAGLVEKMLEAVREQPGALPLLQYALKELYERRQGRVLTLQAYHDIGEVQGALATRADVIFNQLTNSQKLIMRRLLLQLVEVIDDTVTRRRVRLASLHLKGVMPEELQDLIKILTAEQARLLVASAPITREDDNYGLEVDIEVSHEALLTHWERLAGWIADDRDDLRRGSEYAKLADDWSKAKRSETSYLLSGERLQMAEAWLARADATDDQRRFIEASLAAEQARVHADYVQRQRVRRLVAGIGTLAIALAVVIGTAVGINRIAERARQEGQSIILASQARVALNDGDQQLALALATRAVQIENPPEEARRALMEIAMLPGVENVWQDDGREVSAFTFSPDQQKALSVSCADDDCAQQELILWDAQTGQKIRTFQGHTAKINDVVFDATGQYAFSASDDHRIIKWDLNAGDGTAICGEPCQSAILQDEQPVTHLIFSPVAPDQLFSTRCAALESDFFCVQSQLTQWHAISATMIYTSQSVECPEGVPLEDGDCIQNFVFSPDGTSLFMALNGGDIVQWDIEAESPRLILQGHQGRVQTIAISQDGMRLISGDSNDRAILWNIANADTSETCNTPCIERDFTDHKASVTSVLFGPYEQSVWTGDGEGTLRLWDVETGQRIYEAREHERAITQLSSHGKEILSASIDGRVLEWSVASVEQVFAGYPAETAVWRIGYIPGTTDEFFSIGCMKVIEASCLASQIIRWKGSTGERLSSSPIEAGEVWTAAISPDGKYLLLGLLSGTAILWDVAQEKEIETFYEPNGAGVNHVAFNSNGTSFLVSKMSGEEMVSIDLWNMTQDARTLARQLELPPVVVWRADFAPDDSFVFAGGVDGVVYRWSTQTGNISPWLTAHTEAVMKLLVSPDRRLFVTGSDDDRIKVWDIATGELKQEFTEHTNDINEMALIQHPTEGLLTLSIDSVNNLVLWRTETGQILWKTHAQGETNVISYIDVSPDNRYVIIGVGDPYVPAVNAITLRRIDGLQETLSWINEHRVIRELTCEEKRRFNLEQC